jgi:2-desacetyl-2-hydroxyethyl bacteriochlorophyllide A dehydrogenase
MRAAVFAGPGRVEIQDREAPALDAPEDVLVRVRACGICGSDVRALSVPPVMSCVEGIVMGHEFVGEVVAAGPASGYGVGDRVAAVPNRNCGRCAYCRAGEINRCEHFEHLGATRDGAAAEYVVVPGDLVHPLPDALPWDVAALAEPLACVLNGTRRTGWRPGTSTVILGAGPIGLLFLRVAKAAGAAPIIVSEPMASRAIAAREHGADLVVDPSSGELAARVRERTDGLGAEVAIDAVGSLLPDAIACLRKGGLALVFGLDTSARCEISPSDLVMREIRVEGVYITRGTFPEAIATLARDPTGYRRLITDTLPLEGFAAGAEAMRSGAAIKAMVFPVPEGSA